MAKIQVLKNGSVVDVVDNAFCPTGKGGGVDPSCGSGKGGSSSGGISKEEMGSLAESHRFVKGEVTSAAGSYWVLKGRVSGTDVYVSHTKDGGWEYSDNRGLIEGSTLKQLSSLLKTGRKPKGTKFTRN